MYRLSVKSSGTDGGQLELMQFLLAKAFVGRSLFPDESGASAGPTNGGLWSAQLPAQAAPRKLARQLCNFFHLDRTLAAGGKSVMQILRARPLRLSSE